jgi:hypothetical protein
MRAHFVKARVKVHLYPDGSHALFHGPAASADTTRRDSSSRPGSPLKSARRRTACGHVDDATPRPHPHRNKTRRSGHLMGYQNRTT